MKRYRFERRGVLALAADAWGVEYDAAPPTPLMQQGAIAVVTIRGPLTHHSDWFCDSYDAIRARAALAFASPAATVVLRIDSPGGDTSGCFETARELRAMADAAGKPLLVHASGTLCSAAYALACAADEIVVAEETLVGSIGVLAMMLDASEANRAAGLSFRLITSGARKADRYPDIPMSEESIAATQRMVDDLAQLFYALVSERRGVSVDRVRGLEAGVLQGQAARGAGLVDGVATFSQFLALVAGGKLSGGGAAMEGSVNEEDIKKALRALAEGDDEEKAAKAKKALAAMEGEGDEEKQEEAKAESDDEEPPPSEKKEEAKAAASDPLLALAAKVHALEVKDAQREERDERTRLLASRPDFSKEVVAVLRKAEIKTLREAVATWPKGPVKNPAATAQANVQPMRGAEQADARASRLPTEEKRAMDERMGLGKPTQAIRREGTSVVFGVMTPEQARKSAQKEGAK